MGDSNFIRFRAKILRRPSTPSKSITVTPEASIAADTDTPPQIKSACSSPDSSQAKGHRRSRSGIPTLSDRVIPFRTASLSNRLPPQTATSPSTTAPDSLDPPGLSDTPSPSPRLHEPSFAFQVPTPEDRTRSLDAAGSDIASINAEPEELHIVTEEGLEYLQSVPETLSPRPTLGPRQQSLVPASQIQFIQALLEPESKTGARPNSLQVFSPILPTTNHMMINRKIWVKRPGSSPTQVTIGQDDLVDDVRDVILRKYANSLGRNFDSPDVTLKICVREQGNKHGASERTLGPEEPIGRTLDTYYPGGQTVDEALIIDVPPKRTPRPSPHHMPYYIAEELRPGEGAGEYFPPMHVLQPANTAAHALHTAAPHHPPSVHSMSVLTTGQLPPLPSPGSRVHRHHRPKYPRQHTSSPTLLHTVPPNQNVIDLKQSANGVAVPPAPPLPTTPAQIQNEHKPSITPPVARSSSPHAGQKPRKGRKTAAAPASTNLNNKGLNAEAAPPPKPASAGLLDGTVPPINVLIVEDNVINLKLLEAFMRRLKVRWKTAMDGKQAVAAWRTGGFHLVLMDIQLPVMNGLEATKEIRRLEGLNGIGVFSGTPLECSDLSSNGAGEISSEDRLEERSLFKSPVIIVALTASSLQSDRHEALAAGCNDFLTKPVNFPWMERKVTEWGCMQALIDFDGWRKWKDYAQTPQQKKDDRAETKAALKAMFAVGPKKTEKATAAPSGGAASTTSSSTTGNTPTLPKKGQISPTTSRKSISGASRGPPSGGKPAEETDGGGGSTTSTANGTTKKGSQASGPNGVGAGHRSRASISGSGSGALPNGTLSETSSRESI